jgi:ATP-dependent DNA ligase
VSLPLTSPVDPQLARSAKELPLGDQWAYEPKFDGFRAIVFVDGDEQMIQSRSGKPLGRYFPELSFAPGRYVVDGEIVIDDDSDPAHPAQDFGALQQRIHPAESRIMMLAEQTPAHYVAFDLLALEDETLLSLSFEERRAALEQLTSAMAIGLTPLTRDPAGTAPWLAHGEGVVAKDLRATYRPGERKGMVKVKRVRTIDAVVAGYRPGKEEGTVGSLILGLYDDGGTLHVVGHSSGLRAAAKRALVDTLRPYEPLAVRARPGMDLAAAGAGRRGDLRSCLRWPDPPWHEDLALARGQAPARVPPRTDAVLRITRRRQTCHCKVNTSHPPPSGCVTRWRSTRDQGARAARSCAACRRSW